MLEISSGFIHHHSGWSTFQIIVTITDADINIHAKKFAVIGWDKSFFISCGNLNILIVKNIVNKIKNKIANIASIQAKYFNGTNCSFPHIINKSIQTAHVAIELITHLGSIVLIISLNQIFSCVILIIV